MQWFPGTDHLIVDSSDQQTPSINLQTARETPVIHPPRPAFACLWVAPRTDNYVRGVAIRALIGSASTHWIIAFMRFDCQATSSRLPDLPVAKMPITVTASFDFDCKLTAFIYLRDYCSESKSDAFAIILIFAVQCFSFLWPSHPLYHSNLWLVVTLIHTIFSKMWKYEGILTLVFVILRLQYDKSVEYTYKPSTCYLYLTSGDRIQVIIRNPLIQI